MRVRAYMNLYAYVRAQPVCMHMYSPKWTINKIEGCKMNQQEKEVSGFIGKAWAFSSEQQR